MRTTSLSLFLLTLTCVVAVALAATDAPDVIPPPPPPVLIEPHKSPLAAENETATNGTFIITDGGTPGPQDKLLPPITPPDCKECTGIVGPPTVPEKQPDDDEDGARRERGIIAGVVVGGVFVIAAAAGVVVVLRRRGETAQENAVGIGDLHAPKINTGIRFFARPQSSSVAISDPASGASGSNSSNSNVPGDDASVGHSSDDSGNSNRSGETKRLPTSHDRAIDEETIFFEAANNSAAFSAPMRCASGHKVEKSVTVSCIHPGKKPKKATDLRTLFCKDAGHVWSCASCSRTLELTAAQRAKISETRKITIAVEGKPFASVVVPNIATSVYDTIATQLEAIDASLTSQCGCHLDASGKPPKGAQKVSVVIDMELQ